MILEIIGFILSAVLSGLFVYTKLTNDVFPLGVKRALNKLVLTNWIKQLPQIIPVYNTSTPKTVKEAGIVSQDVEWELEQPWKLDSDQEADDMLIHGIDDNGNCLVARITKFSNNMARVSVALRRNGETFTVELDGVSNNPLEFSLGNFKLELIEPFRIWRLWFNGYMRNHGTTSKNNLAHVTINFLWKPLDYAKDFQKNANTSLLADVLTCSGPFGQNFANINEMMPNGYYQFGILHGVATVNGDNVEGKSLYMYGNRTRRRLTLSSKSDIMVEFFAMRDQNGDVLRLISRKGSWIGGEGSYSSTSVYPTQHIDIGAECFDKNSSTPKVFEVKDKRSTMRVEIWPKYEAINMKDSLELLLLQLDINGNKAHGIILRNPNPVLPVPTILFQQLASPENKHTSSIMMDNNEVIIPLESDSCCSVNLVGGKGASLAKLAGMNTRVKDFKTSRGFCTTTNLFRKMVDEQHLKEIFNNKDSSLEKLCLQAIEFVNNGATVENIRPLVNAYLKQTFGESRSSIMRFAVRSSGVLEDGSDLSCAGQNETFLGIEEASIPDNIVKCWASLYKFQSVSYRINHGQPAVTSMGVVIQEMVNASTAGVLFTADPRTGNPFEMLITANYGLGESVVSASCDPDSIIIQRERCIESRLECERKHLSLGSTSIGEKRTKVTLKQGGKCVEEEKTSELDSKRLCLTESSILQLGLIGSKVEKEMGQLKPIDVEWAITENGDIYVLQCRSMTSLDAWTDFEITHQFDTAIRTRIELLTTANTGEVMPKPLYACSVQSMSRNLDVGIQERTSGSGNPVCSLVSRGCPIYCNRVFISVYPTLYRRIDAEINASVSAIDLTVFGRPVITEEVHKVALERYGASSGLSKLSATIDAIRLIKNASKQLEKADMEYKNWTFKLNQNCPITPRTIYDQITADLMIFHDVSMHHCAMSEASSTTLVFAFMVICEGKNAEHWSPSLYEDAGRLLSVYGSVESAELPNDMDALAEAIIKYGGNADNFLHIKSTMESISWLKSNDNLAKALDTFFDKHGHRSIAELDIGQDSWKTDPTPLINLIKNIVKNKINNPTKTSSSISASFQKDEDLLNSLKAPISSGAKKFLKFLLPYARKMVMYRERSKSLTVKVLEQLKFAYYMLAESMVKEMIIPDKTYIKHLTHYEMGLLLDKHHTSSTILYRAIRRMRLYSTLEALEFAEMNVGIPEPLNNSQPVETCDVLKGTPVSAGKIIGTAKVCLSVEDASSQLEEGDILITKGTDIAWSPFFPLLGGVVTELGGLISHGAVVAREYGLPCIVGAVNATKIFRSGDICCIDTSTGTVSKVKMQ